jgi:hypothetical protein
MNTAALIHDLAVRGVEFSVRGDKLIIDAPKGALGLSEIDQLREHKAEVLALLKPRAESAAVVPSRSATTEVPDPASNTAASEALVVLRRLKTFTLPSGRMPAARVIAERLRPLLTVPELDPAAALAALQATEAELTALGGAYEPELADAIGLVSSVFPRTRLIRLNK